jgi:glycosyltransferase involved in cell wall biosynthesis
MKINIISYHNHHSLSADCEVISYCLKKFYRNKKIFFEFHNFQEVKANLADINIFVGVVSNFFIKYAPINILIIDPHKFDEAWIAYLPKIDYILGKTDFAVSLLREKIPRIQNTGWKTLDHYENVEKDFTSFLCVLGISRWRQIKTILELWKPEYPKLHILCSKNYFSNFEIEKKEQDNITYQEEYLPQSEYLKLLNRYGLHLCLSSASSFSNTLQNCLSAKSIPIAMENVLNKNFITHYVSGFLVKCKKKKKLPNNYGSEYLIDRNNFTEVIEKIQKIDEFKLEDISEKGKSEFRQADRTFEKNFKEFFDSIWKKHKSMTPLSSTYQKFDEDFPPVSIITPTRNRYNFFTLAIRNFEKIDYPTDQIEWIIVEKTLPISSSDEKSNLEGQSESIKSLLPDKENIKYYEVNDTMSIGAMRNYAVEKCSHEFIMCMDDDDYYQPGSIKYRVACLEHLQTQVVGCASMAVLEINKIISNVSISSFIQEYYERHFESSFGFRKSFWENNKFSDTNNFEGRGLLEGNIKDFEEISYNPIMISLYHNGNTNRRIQIKGDTNGCHYNLSDKLFNLITNLDAPELKNIDKLNQAIPQNKSSSESDSTDSVDKQDELELKTESESKEEVKTN